MNTVRRAVTLLELLGMLAVVGVLVALVAPRLPLVQQATVRAEIRAELERVREQIEIFHDANDRYPVSIHHLVRSGALTAHPEHPAPGYFEYDSKTGRFCSSVNTSW